MTARTKPEEPEVESTVWEDWTRALEEWRALPLWKQILFAPLQLICLAILAAGAALMAAGFLAFILPFIGFALILFFLLIGIFKGMN